MQSGNGDSLPLEGPGKIPYGMGSGRGLVFSGGFSFSKDFVCLFKSNKDYIYFFESESTSKGKEREKADFPPSGEPEEGLDSTTLRSRPERKPDVVPTEPPRCPGRIFLGLFLGPLTLVQSAQAASSPARPKSSLQP